MTGLNHAVLGAADALDEPLVALLTPGSASGRHRRPASPLLTGLGTVFSRVRILPAYTPSTRGQFTYAEPFSRL